MSERGDLQWVKDIAEAIRRIRQYLKGISYNKFLDDKKTQDAVVRNLEIIGEAVKKISSDFKKKHKDVEWKKIAGFRDKLIHHYFGVNWDILWNAITEKLPELKDKIDDLLKEEKKVK